jgi:hypothetical protein
MAEEQSHKAFDFGVCKGVEVVPPHSCEVDAIIPLPYIDLDIRYTGAQHLSCIIRERVLWALSKIIFEQVVACMATVYSQKTFSQTSNCE